MKKLSCFLGFHKWIQKINYKRCLFCGKAKCEIHVFDNHCKCIHCGIFDHYYYVVENPGGIMCYINYKCSQCGHEYSSSYIGPNT